MGSMRGRNAQIPRSFPPLTPQAYVPGTGAGLYTGLPPMRPPNSFPPLGGNSFMPPVGSIEPPIMNYSAGPRMFPPTMFPTAPPPMPYQHSGSMSMIGPQPSYYDPGPRSYPHRRPARIRCRPRRSRRCRPVIRVYDSDSCSSQSSYTTISSCSPCRHRSRSHSRRCATPAPPQQQQPIILLPIQCQQQQPPPTPVSMQPQIQQQPQQIVLPPIRIQQPGQYDQQQLALPPIAFSQAGGQYQQQQQPFTIPPIQFNSSNILPNTNSSPMFFSSGQQMLQPSGSLPQLTAIAQPQQIQGGTIQYVQAVPQSTSSSPLQYISAEPRSTIAPQRVLVNSTNKKQSTKTKVPKRAVSTREVPQNDLKFGRHPFDWYSDKKSKNIINENVQVGQRRNTIVG